jgi:hypothetical protein
MAKQPEQCFIRQRVISSEKIGIAIPQSATIFPEFRQFLIRTTGIADLPPNNFLFHYLDLPLTDLQLDDGDIITTSAYKFLIRDAAIRVFDLLALWDDEFCWSFCSTSQIIVLVAVKIGETIDVRFDEEFERVFHVKIYNMSSGVPNSGHGQYAVDLAVHALNSQGFRVISSYEPQSSRTQSRLPFLFGFRVFGRMKGDPEFPVWRELIAEATRQALMRQWHHALLYAAFSLESFIDRMLSDKLTVSGVGEAYIDHILRVSEKSYKLHALNNRGLSRRAVNNLAEKLNETIFTPRNKLAHGKTMGSDITRERAVQAVKTAVEFMWDWSRAARPWLFNKVKSFEEELIDDNLLRACRADA